MLYVGRYSRGIGGGVLFRRVKECRKETNKGKEEQKKNKAVKENEKDGGKEKTTGGAGQKESRSDVSISWPAAMYQ